MVSSRQFCGSCLEARQTKNHTGKTRSKGHKFLGSHQAGLFVQQQRFYSGEGRRWIMKQHFKGMPTPEDFDLVSEPLPDLKEGEILIKPEFWSMMAGCSPRRQLSR